MVNKAQLITPFLMLTAGTIASIIMYVRNFDLYRMLWNLLIVLVVFYIIGDITRYIYSILRPRTIPVSNIDQDMLNTLMTGDMVGNVVAVDDDDDGNGNDSDEDGMMYDDGDGYSDEELDGYETDGETDDDEY